jgi:hypothetical protein
MLTVRRKANFHRIDIQNACHTVLLELSETLAVEDCTLDTAQQAIVDADILNTLGEAL